jgi:hypothetical protein
MPSNTFAYRATIGLIWALALWHSWICRGLFVDGFAFLAQITTFEWFFDFYPPRLYAMILAQLPVMAGVILGVTDLHWLARLLSLGLFSLPTLFWTAALYRARNDRVVLAVVIATLGLIFLPVSFFIVGEYNTLYAFAIFICVTLVTGDRLRIGEGAMLAVLAAFATHVYEAMIYIGPFLVAMTLWRVWRGWRDDGPSRSLVATVLYLLAAVLFAVGIWVARDSMIHPVTALSQGHLEETLQQAKLFWQNLQFDLVLIPLLIVLVWALLRPAELATPKPYKWAAIFLVLLALSPLFALAGPMFRPLAKSQYVSRVISGLLVCGIFCFIWFYRSGLHSRLKALVVLRQPQAGSRMLAFACLLPLAVLPSDIYLSMTWVHFLATTRAEVTSHSGVVAFEETRLSQLPDRLLVEDWTVPTQSLILRANDRSAIIRQPGSYTGWVPFAAEQPPDLGRFYWSD